MKEVIVIVEAEPKINIGKSVHLISQLSDIYKSEDIEINVIVFSETKVLAEKLQGLCRVIDSCSGRSVREFLPEDYYKNIYQILSKRPIAGIYALTSFNSEYYLPLLSIDFDLEFIPNCFEINEHNGQILLRGVRYNSELCFETSLNEKGAVVAFMKVDAPETLEVKKIATDSIVNKYDPLKAENSIRIIDEEILQYKNKVDIRDYSSFIGIGDFFTYEDFSERQCEVIAKNITGVKIGDSISLEKGFISNERLAGTFGRAVKFSFFYNAGMNFTPADVNSMLKQGPLISVYNKKTNLLAYFSDEIIEDDPESFSAVFAEELEKKIRY